MGRVLEGSTKEVTTPEDRPLKKIENRIPQGYWRSIDIGPGWYPLVFELDANLAKLFPDYQVHQVKEKFGGLRYYTEAVPKDIYTDWRKLIDEAEAKSFTVCEVCGAEGSTGGKWWIRTLCEQHLAEHLAQEKKRHKTD
jgi:hypothetical protein